MSDNPRPRVGLALSGGAARGLAHVGVLRALKEHQIPIDCIAGSSAGSLVGAAYAAGMSIDEIEKLGRSFRWRYVGWPTLSMHGLQSNKRLEDFVRSRLPKTRFEELLIPLAVVATDLNTGGAVVMSKEGDVPFAIRASCTIPGIYVPVIDEQGRKLVDGGLVAVVPASFARSLGADIVVSVDVNSEGATFRGAAANTIVGVILQSVLAIQRNFTGYQLANSDHIVKPRIGHIRWDQLRRANDLITAGYEAGLKSAPAILELIKGFKK